MTRLGFLPRSKDERRTWLSNFVSKLQGATNAYVAKYNIPAATVTALTQGRQWVEWTFANVATLRTTNQSLTEFQDQVMMGKGGASGDLALPTAPSYTDMPGGNTTPITPVADIVGQAAALGRQIKQKTNYSVADGEDLGLEGPGAPDLPPVETTAPDLTKSRLASGGQVEVVWSKGPFDAIRIEVDRSSNSGGSTPTGYSLLAIDTEPNYIDTVQPAPGTVAIYKYRAIYILSDAPYGQWSQPLEMTVRG